MAAPWCGLTFLSDLWGAHLGGQGAPARGLQSPVPPAAQVRPVGDGHAPRPQEGRGPHPAKEPSKHRSPWPALSFWDVAWTSASLGLSRWAERVSLPRLPLKGLMPLRAPGAGARTAGPQQGRQGGRTAGGARPWPWPWEGPATEAGGRLAAGSQHWRLHSDVWCCRSGWAARQRRPQLPTRRGDTERSARRAPRRAVLVLG